MELFKLLEPILDKYGPVVFLWLTASGGFGYILWWFTTKVSKWHEDAVGELKTISSALVGQAPRLEMMADSVSDMKPDLREVKAGVKEILRKAA